jgi:hypothetical protein
MSMTVERCPILNGFDGIPFDIRDFSRFVRLKYVEKPAQGGLSGGLAQTPLNRQVRI